MKLIFKALVAKGKIDCLAQRSHSVLEINFTVGAGHFRSSPLERCLRYRSRRSDTFDAAGSSVFESFHNSSVLRAASIRSATLQVWSTRENVEAISASVTMARFYRRLHGK